MRSHQDHSTLTMTSSELILKFLVNILARPIRVVDGPNDTVGAELAELLASMGGDMMPVDKFVDQPEEKWTEAVESDEEDAELIAAVQAQTEEVVEDADDSVPRTPWTMREARGASEQMRCFIQENQAEHSKLRE
jgi:hypothetical protein